MEQIPAEKFEGSFGAFENVLKTSTPDQFMDLFLAERANQPEQIKHLQEKPTLGSEKSIQELTKELEDLKISLDIHIDSKIEN